MRYMTIYQAAETGTPPSPEHQEAMGQLITEMSKAGVLIRTDGLLPSGRGSRVRITADGKITVTDGPFTESKEIVGGYAIIDVKSKDEAIEWTKKFLRVAGSGQSEVREMYEQPAFDTDPSRPSLHNADSRR